MQYRTEQNGIFLRVDKGEELIATILEVCRREGVPSGVFHGVGGADRAVLATYLPKRGIFVDREYAGMVEVVSVEGNITLDGNGALHSHSHAVLAVSDDEGNSFVAAGHVKSIDVAYTGEIFIAPAEKAIGRMYDANAGITVWKL